MKTTPKPAPKNAEPKVSPEARAFARAWGGRFKAALKAKHSSLRLLAVRTNGKTEAALRHFTNGTRPVGLWEFFDLCQKSGIDPRAILFPTEDGDKFNIVQRAWNNVDERGKEYLMLAADGVLERYGKPK